MHRFGLWNIEHCDENICFFCKKKFPVEITLLKVNSTVQTCKECCFDFDLMCKNDSCLALAHRDRYDCQFLLENKVKNSHTFYCKRCIKMKWFECFHCKKKLWNLIRCYNKKEPIPKDSILQIDKRYFCGLCVKRCEKCFIIYTCNICVSCTKKHVNQSPLAISPKYISYSPEYFSDEYN